MEIEFLGFEKFVDFSHLARQIEAVPIDDRVAAKDETNGFQVTE